MSIDRFADKAAHFDQNPQRVDNVGSIAKAIIERCRLDRSMHLVDFGSGTGLLLERIAPLVGRITAVDVSAAMNQQLLAKRDRLACPIELRAIDLATTPIAGRFDGIISSMTMHHIADIPGMFGRFHALLDDGGFIALADLESEDGSFHSDDTGVFHHGFDRDAFGAVARGAGFRELACATVSTISKDGRDYPVFLLTAFR
jgi:cyclopropane fatty-acyl-phospholipid synthase-like methyltransferase